MDDRNVITINNQLSIPLSELQFRFSTSSGPGGQHANRAATRATLLFDVAESPSLNAKQRQQLLRKLESRLDKDGVLQISAQDSRSQSQNRDAAIGRFQTLLADALKRQKKRKPTKPSRAAKERRLEKKRQHSQKKANRQKSW